MAPAFRDRILGYFSLAQDARFSEPLVSVAVGFTFVVAGLVAVAQGLFGVDIPSQYEWPLRFFVILSLLLTLIQRSLRFGLHVAVAAGLYMTLGVLLVGIFPTHYHTAVFVVSPMLIVIAFTLNFGVGALFMGSCITVLLILYPSPQNPAGVAIMAVLVLGCSFMVLTVAQTLRSHTYQARIATAQREAEISRFREGRVKSVALMAKSMEGPAATIAMLANANSYSRQTLEDLKGNVNSLSQILGDLNRSIDTAEDVTSSETTCDIRELLYELDRQAKPLLAERGITFVLEEIRLPSPLYQLDRARFRSLLFKVCLSFYHFLESTERLSLYVTAEAYGDGVHWLHFRFTSNSTDQDLVGFNKLLEEAAAVPLEGVSALADLGRVQRWLDDMGGQILADNNEDGTANLRLIVPARSSAL